MAILFFARAHTGQEYCDLVIKVLDVLFSEWRMELIGSSTDGAGNMAGHNSELSALPRNESECSKDFYRIWCLYHQLDLAIRASVSRIDGKGVSEFVSKLKEIIEYLRRQKRLIQGMGAKYLYLLQMRWWFLVKVLN